MREAEPVQFVPIDYDSFSTLLQPFAEFSPAFFERARDASLCFKVQAFFACCAMCGAAAEAVLVSAAVSKLGEQEALKIYGAKGGRAKLEQVMVGQAKTFLKEALHPLFGLIGYWRDQASHGAESGVGRTEATTALRGLFYYAKLVHENWAALTSTAAAV